MAARKWVYVLRTCAVDMTSHGGFRWPMRGHVEAPDWRPVAECGNGLHGLLWGEGDAALLSSAPGTRWLVVKVAAGTTVDLHGKVKYPRGEVVFCGARDGATAHLDKCGAADKRVVFATRTAGDYGTATAGDYGTATAGCGGTATAGDYGTATAGDYGTATAGNRGTATAGDYGTATAGDYGTATAGDYGTATAGNYGTATAGCGGTATAGDYGTATAGNEGCLVIKRWNGKRYRWELANVGEDGIEPNVAYRLDADGRFVKAEG